MFTYKDVKRLVRFKLKDNSAINYSDYELKEATNEVLRYLANEYALQNTDFLEKVQDYFQEEYNDYNFKTDGVPLPDDFVTLLSVHYCHAERKDADTIVVTDVCSPLVPCPSASIPNDMEYKIVGNKIFSGASSFRMVYRKLIPEVTSDTSEIPFPYSFKDSIVKLVCMVVAQNPEMDVLRDAVKIAVTDVVPRRRYSNARIPMPFHC